MEKQAMIFAAGLGTRLKPLTDTRPKALVSVGQKPLLWHVVMKLKQAGFTRIIVNVHHHAQQIIDYLAQNHNFGLDISISDESAGLLDTGGAIKRALPLIDVESHLLIHNVDILSNVNLQKFYRTAIESNCQALLLVSRRQTTRYLLFDNYIQDNCYRLKGWVNTTTGETRPDTLSTEQGATLQKLAFAGIHVLSPQLFQMFNTMPDRFSIIDFYLKMCNQCTLLGYKQDNLQLMDVGKLDTLHQANDFLKQLS